MKELRYLVSALVRRGPRFLLQYARNSLAFDLMHGTHTHLRAPKPASPESDAERRDGVLYVASFTSVVRRTLHEAQLLVGTDAFRESQFFDLGCGKGKALLVHALEYSHAIQRPGVGIEYDSSLCVIANRNIEKLKLGVRAPQVYCDSALNVARYVQGQRLIVYLYNPFGGETLRGVLRALTSFPHVLIYVDPVERGLLQEFGYSIRVSHEGRLHADTWLVADNSAMRPSNQPQTASQIK